MMMAMHHSVSVLIVNDRGEILCHQRNDLKYWGLPGGMVELGESPETAAIREVKEETGLDILIARKIAEYERPQMPGAKVTLHLFQARPVAGVLDPSNHETAALRWATIDTVPGPRNPYLQSYLHDYRSNRPDVIRRALTLPWFWALKMHARYAARQVCRDFPERQG